MRIPHSKPAVDRRDMDAVRLTLQSGLLAQGKKVEEFEKAMARYVSLKNAAAVNSGTSALHLVLLALGIKPNDQVIIPSYVCTALLNAVLYVGASAVIVDVDPDTFNISPDAVKKNINRRTKAVIVPHMFGNPADLKALVRLGVPVIEDCAQTLGASCQGKPVGTWGAAAVCSFYATKLFTTAEGGMVLSNDKKLLAAVKDLRAYDNVGAYKVRFNYKMSDLQAAMGLSQLKKLDGFILRRRKTAGRYDKALALSGLKVPQASKDCGHNYFRYVIKTDKDLNRVIRTFNAAKIDARLPVFKPLHHYYGSFVCPVADGLMKQCLSIPIYPSMSESQIRHVVKTLASL